jgi:hypothetical protein
MAETYFKINTATVGSGGAASINFTSIPATYTDLVLRVSGRSTSAAGAVTIAFNGSSSTFAGRFIQGNGTTASSSTNTTQISTLPISTDTASVFGNFEIYIPNYSDSSNKCFFTDSVTENNLALAFIFLNASMWSTTSVINEITLTAAFAEYSTATLYGISKS